jgi:hypothetical protein
MYAIEKEKSIETRSMLKLSSYQDYKDWNTKFNWLKHVDVLKPIYLPRRIALQFFCEDIDMYLHVFLLYLPQEE